MEDRAATRTPPADFLRMRAAFIGPGWWLPWIGVAAYGVCGFLGVRLAARYGGGFGPPGDDRPLYFLRTDLLSGMCLAAGTVLCLAIALVTWSRYPGSARAMLWISVLWSGGGTWKAILIALNTRHLFDPARTQASRWPTFNSYLTDPLIWAGQAAVLVGALVFATWPEVNALRKRHL
jgi:hypothetical protein